MQASERAADCLLVAHVRVVVRKKKKKEMISKIARRVSIKHEDAADDPAMQHAWMARLDLLMLAACSQADARDRL